MSIKSSNLTLDSLTSITPLDGRYRKKTADLSNYFSEFALIRTRIQVEVKYLLALSDIGVVRKINQKEENLLKDLSGNFTIEDARQVKKIEEKTRHDVKAVERFIRDSLLKTSLSDCLEMIHFGLTSEDINNISYRLMLLDSVQKVLIPTLSEILEKISQDSQTYSSIPMLARTHGQAAVPTTLGKELAVFAVRLTKQIKTLSNSQLTGKLNGAVGNYNSLAAAYPKIDWISFSEKFIKSFDLEPNIVTTQINPADDIAEFLQTLERINNILIGFDQDMWRYISDGWFVLENKKGEVGSSTMPQKVNPIDFENSEGNLGLANSLFEFMARKLTISRLQRDLSDSTVMRSIGTSLAYSQIGYASTMVGLSRVRPNASAIEEALNNDWSILTEAVQTILRKNGVSDSFSQVLKLSRGMHIKKEEWEKWVRGLSISSAQKDEIRKLTPAGYTGLAQELAKQAVAKARKR